MMLKLKINSKIAAVILNRWLKEFKGHSNKLNIVDNTNGSSTSYIFNNGYQKLRVTVQREYTYEGLCFALKIDYYPCIKMVLHKFIHEEIGQHLLTGVMDEFINYLNFYTDSHTYRITYTVDGVKYNDGTYTHHEQENTRMLAILHDTNEPRNAT